MNEFKGELVPFGAMLYFIQQPAKDNKQIKYAPRTVTARRKVEGRLPMHRIDRLARRQYHCSTKGDVYHSSTEQSLSLSTS
eukprot:1103902-Amphidinium_carterae.1